MKAYLPSANTTRVKALHQRLTENVEKITSEVVVISTAK